MLDWTDRHFRYFIRLLAPHCVVYTEMITTGALLYGDAHRFLDYSAEEHPVALQLGGSDPEALAKCALLAKHYGYDEINLNVGCPSDRVQNGRFGACLMKEPSLVAECVSAMWSVLMTQENNIIQTTQVPQAFLENAHPCASVPYPPWSTLPSKMLAEPAPLDSQLPFRVCDFSPLVSVKCRLGVDDQEDFALLENFIGMLKDAGCNHVIVHARKAWLNGLSPKENREIPPLNYPWVYALKKSFPDFKIIINGGIKTVEDSLAHLQFVDGVMLGRPAYDNPYVFRELEEAIFSESLGQSHVAIVREYLPYVQQQLQQGVKLSFLVRPILGLFNGFPGSRQWRRYLSEHMHVKNAAIEVIHEALQIIEKFSSQ